MKTCVLITTYNRALQLSRSLERMQKLTKPDEILVVDDGSIDNTHAVVNSFVQVLPIRYIYNNNPRWSICSMARNIGLKNTDADVIITSEPELLWITDVVPHIMNKRDQYPYQIISAGTVYHYQTRTDFHPGFIIDPVSALHDCKVEDYQIEPRAYTQTGLVKTVNMQATFLAMYERRWLMELGGWDEGFPGSYGFDDIELCTRLRINGINQCIDPTLAVIHQYHDHQPPHIQGPQVMMNDEYFKSKRLDLLSKGDPGLVANTGREWGKIQL